jgi:hypothetical protein
MISETILSEEVKRLMLLPFAGSDPEVVNGRAKEFKRVLRAGVRTNAGLSAVVDDVIEHSEACPAPAVIVDAIRRYHESIAAAENELNAKANEARRASGDWDHKCSVCQDTGWETYDKGTYSFAKACGCSLGMRLAAAREMEAARKAEVKRRKASQANRTED